MIKIMSIFGTRPEAIKMLPIIKEIEANEKFSNITVVTAQHREMLDQVLSFFSVVPDYDLNLMTTNQTLSSLTSKILEELSPILLSEKPDIVLVHGDTSTTLAASLCSFFHKIPIGHVEAGLRTWEKYDPFPEEMNRQLTDKLSDLYFAPTVTSKKNLVQDNVNEHSIFVTGNTVIDALKYTVLEEYHHSILDKIASDSKIILLTMHRRENWGEPMQHTFQAIKEIVEERAEVEVLFPVHLNPKVQNMAKEVFSGVERVHLIEPLNLVDFHNLAAKSYLILTDSGGVQEEAPSLGVPVLVLRETTERPEGVEAGCLRLVGTDRDRIKSAVVNLLKEPDEYEKMTNAVNPYGDGHSAKKILEIIESKLEK